MKKLREVIQEAQAKKQAIGHFNISDLSELLAIFDAARDLNLPVLIGTSEGEREFIGEKMAAAMVRSLRINYEFPIYLNADHTHSLEKIMASVLAGYDAVLFDGGKMPLEENIARTKEVVQYVRSINPDILIEAELGYIGTSSKILTEVPEGAAILAADLTKPEEAAQFVKETGVDLLAPAVGNLHGMFADRPNPQLDIDRIRSIKEEAHIPLVLHGGSGTTDTDFKNAINAGISIVHINTELRKAWTDEVREFLSANPGEIVPYKILEAARKKASGVVRERMKLFSGLY